MPDSNRKLGGLPTASDQLLWDTWLSSFHLPSLTAADEIGLFQYLQSCAASASEIGEHFELSPRAAESLLGLLASLGYLVQHLGRFSLSDVSRNFLLPSSPFYWGGLLHVYRDSIPTHDAIKQALLRDAKDQRPPIDWETGLLSAATARRFTGLMHSHSFPAAMGLARQRFLEGVRRLLDIGGGSGCFSIALALHHPGLQCTVFELPPVCELAHDYIEHFEVKEQVTTTAGDMFKDAFPQGFDAVFYSNILHDWTFEQSLQLGKKAFDCLPSGGRIFVHEVLWNRNKDGPPAAAGLSMVMLKAIRGKQYTADELEALLRESGFVDVVVQHSYCYFSLVAGRKP